LYQNCSLILKFHPLIPGPTNRISTENWQSKSVYREIDLYEHGKECAYERVGICIRVWRYECRFGNINVREKGGSAYRYVSAHTYESRKMQMDEK